MRGARRLVALLVLVPLAMIGCQFSGALDSGAGGATQGTGAILPLRGQVVSTVRMPLTTDLSAVLNSDARDEVAAEGLTLAADGILSKELPLRGRWIVIGTTIAKTDANGVFSIDFLPAGAAAVQVFKQLDDAQAEATFPASALVRQPATPPLLRIPFVYKGPIGMQPGEQPPFARKLAPKPAGLSAVQPFAAASCTECALEPPCSTGDTARACCLDTDGSLAQRCTGKLGVQPLAHPAGPLVSADDCVKARKFQFIGSTCWGFVFNDARRPCVNEGPGADCFTNHGFRNCQHVVPDELTAGFDFTEGDKTRVTPAGSDPVTIGVHSNGWDRFTLVRLTPGGAGGTLAFTPATGSAQTGTVLKLPHTDATAKRFVPDLTFTYTPPATDSGGTTVGDTIELLADTARVTLTAQLRPPPTKR